MTDSPDYYSSVATTFANASVKAMAVDKKAMADKDGPHGFFCLSDNSEYGTQVFVLREITCLTADRLREKLAMTTASV